MSGLGGRHSGRVGDANRAGGLRPEPRTASQPKALIPSRYEVVPVTGRKAIAWVAETHRHLPKLQGALYAVGVARNGELVGVATAGNPPRVWQGTGRVVITRCAALSPLPPVIGRDGVVYPAPVCTMLYGALCRASEALGYREVWTYTLPGEGGASLRAANFTCVGQGRGGEWSREDRVRDAAISAEPKLRWMYHFGNPVSEMAEAA